MTKKFFFLFLVFTHIPVYTFGGCWPRKKRQQLPAPLSDQEIINNFAKDPHLLPNARDYEQFKEVITRVKKQKKENPQTQVALNAVLSHIAETKHISFAQTHKELTWLRSQGAGVLYTPSLSKFQTCKKDFSPPLYRFLYHCSADHNQKKIDLNEKSAALLFSPHVPCVFTIDGETRSCLDRAIKAKMLPMIKLLVNAKADVNELDYFSKQHPIFESSYKDEEAVTVFNILADAGLDIDNTRKFHKLGGEKSLVHFAREWNKPKLTAALLMRGAFPGCECGCAVIDTQEARKTYAEQQQKWKQWKKSAETEVTKYLSHNHTNMRDLAKIVMDYCSDESWQYPEKQMSLDEFHESKTGIRIEVQNGIATPWL